MGLDVGDVRIGIALSDESRLLATAAGIVVRSKGRPARRVVEMARDQRVGRIVVGLPVNADGTLGPQARRVRNFAARLVEELREVAPEVEVVFWNEYLSSQIARERLLQSGAGKKKRRQPVDALAAEVILQEYLDADRGKAPG